MEPVLFTTFASPHLGTVFNGDGWHVNIFNSIGSTMIGQSGRDLFLKPYKTSKTDTRPVLERLADTSSVFFKALAAFRKRVLYANAINDRTVPFYTAYIIDKDPFAKRKFCHLVHFRRPSESESSTPSSTLTSTYAEIDVENSSYIGESLTESKNIPPTSSKWNEETLQVAAFLTLTPLLLPFIFIASGIGTVLSDIRISNMTSQTIQGQASAAEHGKPSRRKSISDNVARMTGAAIDDLLGHEDGDDDDTDDTRNDVFTEDSGSATPVSLHDSKLYADAVPYIPVAPVVTQMMENLNSLVWEKHVLLFHRRHSHAEIVNRRNKPGQGGEIIRAWVDTIRKFV